MLLTKFVINITCVHLENYSHIKSIARAEYRVCI